MLKQYIIVFLISMVPLIELRGAVPYAIASGLPVLPSYIIAIIGNMIPVPIIFFFARKVLEWGKRQTGHRRLLYLLPRKRTQGRRETKRESRKGTLLGAFPLCRNSTSWNRCMDRYSCCINSGYGF